MNSIKSITRVWRDASGRTRRTGPISPGDETAMREWIAGRARAMLDPAPHDESARAGIEMDRARGFLASKGLAVRPVVVTSPPALRAYRDRLVGAGYPMDALDMMADPDDPVAASSIPETGIIVALWARGMPHFSETVIVHELAHGSFSIPQEWTAELTGTNWHLVLPRGGHVVRPVPQRATGDLLEEGFTQLLAAEYAREVLGSKGMLPAGTEPDHLADIPGQVWKSVIDQGKPVYVGASWAAAALQQLIDVRPGLYGALLRARRDASGLTEVARIIDSVEHGLYRRLRALPYSIDGSRAGLGIVRRATDQARLVYVTAGDHPVWFCRKSLDGNGAGGAGFAGGCGVFSVPARRGGVRPGAGSCISLGV